MTGGTTHLLVRPANSVEIDRTELLHQSVKPTSADTQAGRGSLHISTIGAKRRQQHLGTRIGSFVMGMGLGQLRRAWTCPGPKMLGYLAQIERSTLGMKGK